MRFPLFVRIGRSMSRYLSYAFISLIESSHLFWRLAAFIEVILPHNFCMKINQLICHQMLGGVLILVCHTIGPINSDQDIDANEGYNYILVMIDTFSRFIQSYLTKSTSAQSALYPFT